MKTIERKAKIRASNAARLELAKTTGKGPINTTTADSVVVGMERADRRITRSPEKTRKSPISRPVRYIPHHPARPQAH